MVNFTECKSPAGLYSPQFEHDNCGIGAVVDIKGRKSHRTLDDALQIVEHLEHRAGKDAEGKTGDGVGILTQISDKFFKKSRRSWVFLWEKSANTALVCSFFRRTS